MAAAQATDVPRPVLSRREPTMPWSATPAAPNVDAVKMAGAYRVDAMTKP